MAVTPPTRGQQDWDDEMNNALQSLDAAAQSAAANASTAVSTANSARDIAQSVHTAVIGTADAATAGFINTPASETATALSAKFAPLGLTLIEGDPTAATSSGQALEDAATAAALGDRAIILPARENGRAVYTLDRRITLESFVGLVGDHTGMVTVRCITAGAGIDVGNGVAIPYRAMLESLIIDGNNIATMPLRFRKISEVYIDRVWVDRPAPGSPCITVEDALGVELNQPILSNADIGLHLIGTEAAWVNINHGNFYEVAEAIRASTTVTSLTATQTWFEDCETIFSVNLTGFASFGPITFNDCEATGTKAGHRLFHLVAASAGCTLSRFLWRGGVINFPSSTTALVDTSPVNNPSSLRFEIDRPSVTLGGSVPMYAKHPSQGWWLIYFRICNVAGMTPSQFPVSEVDAYSNWEISHSGRNRLGNGFIVNPDTSSDDGHTRWNNTSGRMEMLSSGTYRAVILSGDTNTISATTAELASAAHAINTTGKTTGKQVYNTTTRKPVWSGGTLPEATWNNADGTTAHTPV